jgi:dTDP-4-dehydrorhamnose 3,5-epimerase-like enzyme
VRDIRKFEDDRGWLTELFRHDELAPEFFPVMAYISSTLPGVTRGPHEHVDQADLFVSSVRQISSSACGTTGRPRRLSET